jgi:transglutaminase-like putative cysteine protease
MRTVSGEAELDYTYANDGYVHVMYVGNAEKKCKVRITHMDSNQGFHFSVFPNKTTTYPLTYGDGDYRIEVFKQVDTTRYSLMLSKEIHVLMANPLSPNLYPNTYCSYTSESMCVIKAAELCNGLTTDVEKSNAMYHWIENNITYDFEEAKLLTSADSHWYVPNPDEVLMYGKAICFGNASLLSAMHRSQGIPCRVAIGNVKAGPGYTRHAWNELYWTSEGKLNSCFTIPARKWTLVDVTFDIKMKDKQIADWISNPNNYVTEYRG